MRKNVNATEDDNDNDNDNDKVSMRKYHFSYRFNQLSSDRISFIVLI